MLLNAVLEQRHQTWESDFSLKLSCTSVMRWRTRWSICSWHSRRWSCCSAHVSLVLLKIASCIVHSQNWQVWLLYSAKGVAYKVFLKKTVSVECSLWDEGCRTLAFRGQGLLKKLNLFCWMDLFWAARGEIFQHAVYSHWRRNEWTCVTKAKETNAGVFYRSWK